MNMIKTYKRDPETKEISESELPGTSSIKKTKVKDYEVSTVFLGMDHSFGSGKPVLWETMVFEDRSSFELQLRYTSETDAEDGHAKVVAFLESGGEPDDYDW